MVIYKGTNERANACGEIYKERETRLRIQLTMVSPGEVSKRGDPRESEIKEGAIIESIRTNVQYANKEGCGKVSAWSKKAKEREG